MLPLRIISLLAALLPSLLLPLNQAPTRRVNPFAVLATTTPPTKLCEGLVQSQGAEPTFPEAGLEEVKSLDENATEESKEVKITFSTPQNHGLGLPRPSPHQYDPQSSSANAVIPYGPEKLERLNVNPTASIGSSSSSPYENNHWGNQFSATGHTRPQGTNFGEPEQALNQWQWNLHAIDYFQLQHVYVPMFRQYYYTPGPVDPAQTVSSSSPSAYIDQIDHLPLARQHLNQMNVNLLPSQPEDRITTELSTKPIQLRQLEKNSMESQGEASSSSFELQNNDFDSNIKTRISNNGLNPPPKEETKKIPVSQVRAEKLRSDIAEPKADISVFNEIPQVKQKSGDPNRKGSMKKSWNSPETDHGIENIISVKDPASNDEGTTAIGTKRDKMGPGRSDDPTQINGGTIAVQEKMESSVNRGISSDKSCSIRTGSFETSSRRASDNIPAEESGSQLGSIGTASDQLNDFKTTEDSIRLKGSETFRSVVEKNLPKTIGDFATHLPKNKPLFKNKGTLQIHSDGKKKLHPQLGIKDELQRINVRLRETVQASATLSPPRVSGRNVFSQPDDKTRDMAKTAGNKDISDDIGIKDMKFSGNVFDLETKNTFEALVT